MIGPVAQGIEHEIPNLGVAGSIPAGITIHFLITHVKYFPTLPFGRPSIIKTELMS
jgi:hypothetical protein